ncbi:MAG: hypothetical protein AAFU03_11075, partial [Bacteroidota bacterium]
MMVAHDTLTLRKAISDQFGVGVNDLQLIRSYGNLVYDAGSQVIRLTHSTLRETSNIEAEIYWLRQLGEDKMPVVHLLQSLKGNLWEVIPAEGDHYFTAVAFEKLSGER